MTDPTRAFLRHTLATLAYRSEKVLRDVPDGFAELRVAPTSRTPLEILSHLLDLLAWGERLAHGDNTWAPSPAASWDEGVERFYAGLAAFDAALAEEDPQTRMPERIFQGPVADALTHVGQLALLRGIAGGPVRPESYLRAAIERGGVGREQPSARAEFDGDASYPVD